MQSMIDAPAAAAAKHWTVERAINQMEDRAGDLDRRLQMLSPEELPSFRRDFNAFRLDLMETLWRFRDAHDDLKEELEEAQNDLDTCFNEDNYEQAYIDVGRQITAGVRAFRRTFDWFQTGGRDLRDLEDAMRELEAIVP